ncbi:MAG: FliM/FliN family flagellar motor switch protein [Deltaproteobacteria bacterium]|nr:FliM/FliN family flagellar motor switch protein [Deltaproteobacteria bacterium]
MPSGGPNFSPYPAASLRRLSRADAALETALARWLVARPIGAKVSALLGDGARARIIGTRGEPFDPHAAHAELRIAGQSIVVACASRPIRALAQKLFGGPKELDAPRALTPVEEAAWVLVVASALEDTGVPGEVWACEALPPGAYAPRRETVIAGRAKASTHVAIELAITRSGAPWTVVAYVPRSLEVRVPPSRPLPDWAFEVPIIVGRCVLPRAAMDRLAVRDVVTIDRELSLVVGDGTVGLTAAPLAVEARVAIGYVPAPMTQALADSASVELVVQLGTTRMTLRQLGELSPGAIISLGRPLGGPFEVRAGGRLIGRGELVDVDGELGVRIVSLEE